MTQEQFDNAFETNAPVYSPGGMACRILCRVMTLAHGIETVIYEDSDGKKRVMDMDGFVGWFGVERTVQCEISNFEYDPSLTKTVGNESGGYDFFYDDKFIISKEGKTSTKELAAFWGGFGCAMEMSL
jgi:hypothetical protein